MAFNIHSQPPSLLFLLVCRAFKIMKRQLVFIAVACERGRGQWPLTVGGGQGEVEATGETCKRNVLPCGRFLGRAVKTGQRDRAEGGRRGVLNAWGMQLGTVSAKKQCLADLLGSAPKKTKSNVAEVACGLLCQVVVFSLSLSLYLTVSFSSSLFFPLFLSISLVHFSLVMLGLL